MLLLHVGVQSRAVRGRTTSCNGRQLSTEFSEMTMVSSQEIVYLLLKAFYCLQEKVGKESQKGAIA